MKKKKHWPLLQKMTTLILMLLAQVKVRINETYLVNVFRLLLACLTRLTNLTKQGWRQNRRQTTETLAFSY